MVGATLADVVRVLVEWTAEQLVKAVLSIIIVLSREHVFRQIIAPTLGPIFLVHPQLLFGGERLHHVLRIGGSIQLFSELGSQFGSTETDGLRQSQSSSLRAHPLVPGLFELLLDPSELRSTSQPHVVVRTPLSNPVEWTEVLLPQGGHVHVIFFQHDSHAAQHAAGTFGNLALSGVSDRIRQDGLPIHAEAVSAATMGSGTIFGLHVAHHRPGLHILMSKLHPTNQAVSSRCLAGGQKIGRCEGRNAGQDKQGSRAQPHFGVCHVA
mmetsp:Transcript_25952/g.56865  ORF Transcript_25952/g.56865 Transcript_25952/m.56865 type:complete len:267 (-) Transcript_25952:41-841(-)